MLRPFRPAPSPGFTVLELLVAVGILGLLAAIAVPKLLSAQQTSKYTRAACESKTAVTQGIVYANDTHANPGTLTVLRESGYATISDADPWGATWVTSPAFADRGTPAHPGELGVCSTGPRQTGDCPFPMPGPGVAQQDGSVGYSSLYGSWQGAV